MALWKEINPANFYRFVPLEEYTLFQSIYPRHQGQSSQIWLDMMILDGVELDTNEINDFRHAFNAASLWLKTDVGEFRGIPYSQAVRKNWEKMLEIFIDNALLEIAEMDKTELNEYVLTGVIPT